MANFNTAINAITNAVGTTAKQLNAIPRYCVMNTALYKNAMDYSFSFDVIRQEEIDFQVVYPKQWIQSGLNIFDHIQYPEGIKVVLNAIVYANPVANGGFLGVGNSTSTNLLKTALDKSIAAGIAPSTILGNPTSNVLFGNVGTFDTKVLENFLGSSRRAGRAFNLLLQAMVNGTNFSVSTGMGVYNNIFISRIQEMQNGDNQLDLMIRLEMTQLLIADQILGGATQNAFVGAEKLPAPYNFIAQTTSEYANSALETATTATDFVKKWI